jgi:hypothetical protein
MASKVVRYTGMSDVRSITVADFDKASVKGQKNDLVWDASNDFTVNATSISEGALALILTDGEDFIVEEVGGNAVKATAAEQSSTEQE